MQSSFGRKGPPSPLLRAEGERGSPEGDAFLSEPLRGPVISLLTVHFYLCSIFIFVECSRTGQKQNGQSRLCSSILVSAGAS